MCIYTYIFVFAFAFVGNKGLYIENGTQIRENSSFTNLVSCERDGSPCPMNVWSEYARICLGNETKTLKRIWAYIKMRTLELVEQ